MSLPGSLVCWGLGPRGAGTVLTEVSWKNQVRGTSREVRGGARLERDCIPFLLLL